MRNSSQDEILVLTSDHILDVHADIETQYPGVRKVRSCNSDIGWICHSNHVPDACLKRRFASM
jgi:hypothetical protein